MSCEGLIYRDDSARFRADVPSEDYSFREYGYSGVLGNGNTRMYEMDVVGLFSEADDARGKSASTGDDSDQPLSAVPHDAVEEEEELTERSGKLMNTTPGLRRMSCNIPYHSVSDTYYSGKEHSTPKFSPWSDGKRNVRTTKTHTEQLILSEAVGSYFAASSLSVVIPSGEVIEASPSTFFLTGEDASACAFSSPFSRSASTDNSSVSFSRPTSPSHMDMSCDSICNAVNLCPLSAIADTYGKQHSIFGMECSEECSEKYYMDLSSQLELSEERSLLLQNRNAELTETACETKLLHEREITALKERIQELSGRRRKGSSNVKDTLSHIPSAAGNPNAVSIASPSAVSAVSPVCVPPRKWNGHFTRQAGVKALDRRQSHPRSRDTDNGQNSRSTASSSSSSGSSSNKKVGHDNGKLIYQPEKHRRHSDTDLRSHHRICNNSVFDIINAATNSEEYVNLLDSDIDNNVEMDDSKETLDTETESTGSKMSSLQVKDNLIRKYEEEISELRVTSNSLICEMEGYKSKLLKLESESSARYSMTSHDGEVADELGIIDINNDYSNNNNNFNSNKNINGSIADSNTTNNKKNNNNKSNDKQKNTVNTVKNVTIENIQQKMSLLLYEAEEYKIQIVTQEKLIKDLSVICVSKL